MPKMIVSIDGVVIKEVQLIKDRTSLGRRPYNDIVIDNLAVSGEHAVLQMSGFEVYVEDLNSTNGTYINGKAVKKQLLKDGDIVEIGKYKIKYANEIVGAGSHDADAVSAGSLVPATVSSPATPSAVFSADMDAAIKVLTGAAAGREVALIKVVTTIGKPGVAVAAITRRLQGFAVAHVEGTERPSLNGTSIGEVPVALKNGDVLEVAGTQMKFVQN